MQCKNFTWSWIKETRFCEIETLRTLVGDGKPEPALTTKEEPAARCDTKGAKEATLAPRKKRESRLAPTQGAAATNALAAAAVAMITTALSYTHKFPLFLLVLVLRCEAGHQLVPKWVDARRARLRGLRCSVAGAVAGWMLTTMAPFGLVECAIRGVRTQPILGRLHRLIHNPPPASPPSIACELPRSHPPRGLASPRRPQSAPRSHLSSSLAL